MTKAENLTVQTCCACNGIVSTSAKLCPHCGQKNPSKRARKSITGVLCLILAGIMLVFGVLSNFAYEPEFPVAHPADKAYSEELSRKKCHDKIYDEASNPSTVSFNVTGYTDGVYETSERLITQIFTAKNQFNLKQRFQAECLFQPNGEMKFRFIELRGD